MLTESALRGSSESASLCKNEGYPTASVRLLRSYPSGGTRKGAVWSSKRARRVVRRRPVVGDVGGTARANRPPLRPFRSPGASKRYLLGLLGRVERKNGWQLAEAIGERDPQGACRAAARRRVLGGASRPGRRWRQTLLGVDVRRSCPGPGEGDAPLAPGPQEHRRPRRPRLLQGLRPRKDADRGTRSGPVQKPSHVQNRRSGLRKLLPRVLSEPGRIPSPDASADPGPR